MTDWHLNGTQEDTRMTDQTLPTKEEWIAALRSGEYKQHNGGLIGNLKWYPDQKTMMLDLKHNSFCCLAVYISLQYKKGYDEVIGEQNMPLCEPSIKDKISTLIRMNDGTGFDRPKTFAEIADYLESLP